MKLLVGVKGNNIGTEFDENFETANNFIICDLKLNKNTLIENSGKRDKTEVLKIIKRNKADIIITKNLDENLKENFEKSNIKFFLTEDAKNGREAISKFKEKIKA